MTPQEEFQKMMDYSGVTHWHSKGYKGEGVNLLNCESPSIHGGITGRILERVCPGANLIQKDISLNFKNGELVSAGIMDNGIRVDLCDFVKANKIDMMNFSYAMFETGKHPQSWVDYCVKMQEETGVIMFNAAGNEYPGDGETLFTTFPPETTIYVGALGVANNRLNYSSVGQELDFMAYSGLGGGTSCASPFLMGMCALIQQRYRKMLPNEMYNYLKRTSVDLGAPGDDIYHGEGMVVLPNETVIELWIGKNIMLVDGVSFTIDESPKINPMTGRTLMPVRAIAEGFGAEVIWNDAEDKITLKVAR